MSFKSENILSLIGIDFSKKTEDDLRIIFSEVFKKGMHGICFSPYLDDQKPGSVLSEEQIRLKLELISPHAQWIRIFSCTDGNEMIPRIAREYGFKTLVGAWLGEDLEKNEEEIANLIQIAKAGFADLVAVGHVDGIQHVAGNLLNFVSWLGFHTPEVAIASWVGENDEDTTKDWVLIENNKYTQEDLQNMVNSALRLACALKSHTAEESGGT